MKWNPQSIPTAPNWLNVLPHPSIPDGWAIALSDAPSHILPPCGPSYWCIWLHIYMGSCRFMGLLIPGYPSLLENAAYLQPCFTPPSGSETRCLLYLRMQGKHLCRSQPTHQTVSPEEDLHEEWLFLQPEPTGTAILPYVQNLFNYTRERESCHNATAVNWECCTWIQCMILFGITLY